MSNMAATNFTISATKLSQFRATFKTVTSNGTLMGAVKARTLMLRSNLPREILRKIWELADHDCDGNLTSDEFAIAMHLMSICKGGGTLPAALPSNLIPPLAPDALAIAPAGSTWIVTNELKGKYYRFFASIDRDNDGFLYRDEVMPIFIASKVPQPTLSHIWTLCDIENVGKLNCEQFSLAMYFIAEKIQGREPPTKLTPQMIPPSCRNKMQQKQPQAAPLLASIDPLMPLSTTAAAAATAPIKLGGYSTIKELYTLNGEVEQFGRELKKELVEKPDTMQQKKSEINAMHLVSICKGGETLPAALSSNLIPPLAPDAFATVPAGSTWIGTNKHKGKYDKYFASLDKDNDGFVSRDEFIPTFIASKVPKPTVAHIWTLCDIENVGKLNCKQFSLAMYFIAEKIQGREPPTKLTPQMIPPSCRNKMQQKQPQAAPLLASIDPLMPLSTTAAAAATAPIKLGDYSAIKELYTLHGEVEQFGRELKKELVEKQDAMQQKKSEINSLKSQLEQCLREQKELDMQKQLANQQLAQLDQRKSSVTKEREKLQQQYQMECTVVQQLKDQLSQQEEAIKAEELGLQKLHQQKKDIKEEECLLKAQKLNPKSYLFPMSEEELGCIANASDDGTIDLLSFGGPYRARIELRCNQGAIVMHAFTSEEAKDCLHSLKQKLSSLKLAIHIDLTTLQLKYMKMNKQDVLKLCKVAIESFKNDSPKLKLEGVKSQVERSKRVLQQVLKSIVSKSHSRTHSKYILMWKKCWQELNDQIYQDRELYVEFNTSVSNDAITCELTVVGDNVQKVENAIASVRKIDGSFKECVVSTDAMGVKIHKEGLKSGKLNIRKDLIYHVEVTETSIVIVSPYSIQAEEIHKTVEEFISLEKEKRKIIKKLFSLKYSFLAKKLKSDWSEVQEIAKSNKILSVNLVTDPCCGIEVKGNELAIRSAEPQISQYISSLENDVICSVIPVDYYSHPSLTSPELLQLCKELENDFPVSLTAEIFSSYIIQPYSRNLMLAFFNGSISLDNSDAIVNFTDGNLAVSQELQAVIGESAVFDCKHRIQQCGPPCPRLAINNKNPMVIHAVMPKWIDGNHGESSLIYDAIIDSLKVAADCNITSVSLPFLNSIDKRIPVECLAAACITAVDIFCEQPTCIDKIRFVLPISMIEKFENEFITDFSQEWVPGHKANSKPSDSDNNLVASTSFETIWQWKDDDSRYHTYQAAENDILNQESAVNSTCSLKIGKVTYKINFNSMTQTNTRTSKVRSIYNITIDHTWLYKNDLQKWEQFSSQDSIKIETLYVTGTHDTVEINGNVCSYDFDGMKQLNHHNLRKTDIKRVAISDLSIATKDRQNDCGESKVLVFGLPADMATPVEKIKDCIKSLTVVEGFDIQHKLVPLFDQHMNKIQKDCRVQINLSDKLSDTVVKFNVTGNRSCVQKAITALAVLQCQILTSSSTPSVERSFTKPIEWEPQSDSIELKDVAQGSTEWNKILCRMQETIPSVNLISIKRVQNEFLWEKYCQHKERMGRKGAERVNEMELFHGTSSTPPEDIYMSEEGFDMRFSREGLWGQGNYFAENAQYSCSYAYAKKDPSQLQTYPSFRRHNVHTSSSIKQMFLVKVLTGNSYKSHSNKTLRMPPYKPSTSPEKVRYDTINGIAHGSRIYITYSNDKAYPLYLISYTHDK